MRELKEELQLDMAGADFMALGPFSAPAANEAATQVHAQVFVARHPLQQAVHIAAEIAAFHWLPLDQTLPDHLGPLLRGHILPALLARRATPVQSAAHPGA